MAVHCTALSGAAGALAAVLQFFEMVGRNLQVVAHWWYFSVFQPLAVLHSFAILVQCNELFGLALQ